MTPYDPHAVEAKWRERWPRERRSYELSEGDNPYYCLDMFSYPSGEGLHMGHWRPYTIADVWSRYQTLLGKKVLHPVGFDSFGLPAENHAIKTKTHPAEHTQKAIANFKRQLTDMGTMYDWSTYVETSSPEYYRWTQWLFIQLYKHGLAYRKAAQVNWCPSCQTVLANEQVVNGRCERCGTEVIKKELRQWFLKITDFADDLLDFDGLDWPERVKTLQREWIGKSEGVELEFKIKDTDSSITVFTTRVDTLYGVTYIVLAPEHPLVNTITQTDKSHEVQAYQNEALNKAEIDRVADDKTKTGVFTGSYAINPATHEEIPIWIADYVLATYGTGAVMAVPAHDKRDYEFATTYSLPIKHVIEPMYLQTTDPGKVRENEPFDEREAIIAIVKHWSEDKYLALKWKTVAWGTFVTGGIEEGQTAELAAIAEIAEETGYIHPKLVKNLGKVHGKFYHVPKQTNRWAKAQVLYFELEDDARQPTSETENSIHEVLWLTKNELENFLTPDTHRYSLRSLFGNSLFAGHGILVKSGEFSGMPSEEAAEKITMAVGGKMTATYRLRDWLVSRQRYWGAPIPIIYCDACGEQTVPESDLPVLLPHDAEFMPTGGSPLERHPYFKHVSCPNCGGAAVRDTDTLDTFVDSSWYYLRYTDPQNVTAPFNPEQVEAWLPVDMYVGGIEHAILHLLYARFMMKALHRLELVPYHEPFQRFVGNGMVYLNGQKMSKSKGNVVNPDEIVAKFGTDAMRGYICFMGPVDQDVEWQSNGIVGIARFLDRAWRIMTTVDESKTEMSRPIEEAYVSITQLLPKLQYNRCISALMTALNSWGDQRMSQYEAEIVTQLMAPFFPHFAEEIWEKLGHAESIFTSEWPHLSVAAQTHTTYAIQVNGKTRATFDITVEADQSTIIEQAQSEVHTYISNKNIIKTIVVPGRIVNFVVQ